MMGESSTRSSGGNLDAGSEGSVAARVYRAIGDFALAGAGGEAALLALDTRLQENDRAVWTRAYRAVDRAEHTHIWQLREELPALTDDDAFETILSLVVGGLARMAPRPWSCRTPEPQTAETSRR